MENKNDKPIKKSNKELWILIEEKIQQGDYLFLSHAKKRQKDRNISDIDVLAILENKFKRNRKRNKSKDSYKKNYIDWNYCIEGSDSDNNKIRIIVSFEAELNLLIITVINLEQKNDSEINEKIYL